MWQKREEKSKTCEEIVLMAETETFLDVNQYAIWETAIHFSFSLFSHSLSVLHSLFYSILTICQNKNKGNILCIWSQRYGAREKEREIEEKYIYISQIWNELESKELVNTIYAERENLTIDHNLCGKW